MAKFHGRVNLMMMASALTPKRLPRELNQQGGECKSNAEFLPIFVPPDDVAKLIGKPHDVDFDDSGEDDLRDVVKTTLDGMGLEFDPKCLKRGHCQVGNDCEPCSKKQEGRIYLLVSETADEVPKRTIARSPNRQNAIVVHYVATLVYHENEA